jgi:hypothetical protein
MREHLAYAGVCALDLADKSYALPEESSSRRAAQGDGSGASKRASWGKDMQQKARRSTPRARQGTAYVRSASVTRQVLEFASHGHRDPYLAECGGVRIDRLRFVKWWMKLLA